MTEDKPVYGHKWRKARLIFLQNNPLCRYCQAHGKVTAATVIDHIKPHKGNTILFWDTANWQALCTPHHQATKQAEERGKMIKQIGIDGWPI